MKKPKAHKLIW